MRCRWMEHRAVPTLSPSISLPTTITSTSTPHQHTLTKSPLTQSHTSTPSQTNNASTQSQKELRLMADKVWNVDMVGTMFLLYEIGT